MSLDEIIKIEQSKEKSPLAKEIVAKLVHLGFDLKNHNEHSFNRGVNVGETKAYTWVLDWLRKHDEEL